MHIILGILATVAALFFVFSRISRHAGDVVDDARGLANLPRKLKWQARQRRTSIRALEDPREAAVVLLLGIARTSGDISSAQKGVIAAFAEGEFGISRDEARDLILLAHFMLREVFDFGDELRNVLVPIETHTGPAERHRLIEAARAVAEADDGSADEPALALIAAVEQKLMPQKALPA